MDAITALTLLNQILAQAMALGQLIEKARQEDREITIEELDKLALYDDQVRGLLQASIERARLESNQARLESK